MKNISQFILITLITLAIPFSMDAQNIRVLPNPSTPAHYGGTTKVKLLLKSDGTVKRSRIANDNNTATQWVIVHNGKVVLQRNARNEMSYKYFGTKDGLYKVYVQQFIDGKYQVISNVVAYRRGASKPKGCIVVMPNPSRPAHYGGNIKAKLKLTQTSKVIRSNVRNDNDGALHWVIKHNGKVVLKRNARNEMNYTYFGKKNGVYTIHLEQFIAGKYQVISNVVRYRRICNK